MAAHQAPSGGTPCILASLGLARGRRRPFSSHVRHCKMRFWFSISSFWLALLASSESIAATTLCNAGEASYFSCELKSSRKVLSLCGGPISDSESFWVQYRYGRPRHVEMAFPLKRIAVKESGFEFRRHLRMGGASDYEVAFTQGSWHYVVFSWISGEEGADGVEYGVFVSRGQGGAGSKLVCLGRPDASALRTLVDAHQQAR